jgi:hypothetical protein
MPLTTLDTLPLDLQYHILRYLDLPRPPSLYSHPFLTLSLVSKTLLATVESHSTHLLHRLLSRFPNTAPKRIPSTNSRRTYLVHTTKRCRYCDAKTNAVAKIFNFIPCCRYCDARQWPEKITLTKARTTYGLKTEMLLEKCHWGAYYCVGVYTRMFDEREVRRLAERVHGDLEAWLERKRQKAEKRRKRKTERMVATEGLRMNIGQGNIPEWGVIDLTAGSASNTHPPTTRDGGGQQVLAGATHNTHPPTTGDQGAMYTAP